jgi:hypothetical protein
MITDIYDIILELKQNIIELNQNNINLRQDVQLLIKNTSHEIKLEKNKNETLEEDQDETFEEDQDETFEEDQDETLEEGLEEGLEENHDEPTKIIKPTIIKMSEFVEDWLIHQTYSNHIPFNILFNNHIDYSDYFNKNKLGIPHFVATSFVTEIHKLEYEKRPIHFLKDNIAVCNYESKDNAWKYHPYTSQTLCNIIKELIISIKKYTIDYINFNKISLEFDNIDDKTNNDIDDKTFMRRVVNYNISPGIVLGKIKLIL